MLCFEKDEGFIVLHKTEMEKETTEYANFVLKYVFCWFSVFCICETTLWKLLKIVLTTKQPSLTDS